MEYVPDNLYQVMKWEAFLTHSEGMRYLVGIMPKLRTICPRNWLSYIHINFCVLLDM